MYVRSRFLLAAVCAALVMAYAAAGASAIDLSINERGFSVRWASLRFNPAIGSVSCAVTLHGTLHRREIDKIAELLMGVVNGATISNCTGGSATILTATLPWHIRYQRFTGTLPRITGIGITIIGVALQVNIGGVVCLARTSVAEPAGGTILISTTTGAATQLRADETYEIDLDDVGFLCDIAGDANLIGTAALDGDSVEPLVIRLI